MPSLNRCVDFLVAPVWNLLDHHVVWICSLNSWLKRSLCLDCVSVVDSDPTHTQHHHHLCMPKYRVIFLFLVDVFFIEVVACVMPMREDRGIQAQDSSSGEEESYGQNAQR